jgi:hypothetical protein
METGWRAAYAAIAALAADYTVVAERHETHAVGAG